MPNSQPIVVIVQLRYWEAYQSGLMVTVRLLRKVLIAIGIMAALTVALYVFALIRPRPESDWLEILRNSKPVFLLIGLLTLFVFAMPLLSASRVIRNKVAKGGTSYNFSPSGIHIESSAGTAKLQWIAIQRVVETPSLFFILRNSPLMYTIPKRAFADSSDVAAFRDLARAKVQEGNPKAT